MRQAKQEIEYRDRLITYIRETSPRKERSPVASPLKRSFSTVQVAPPIYQDPILLEDSFQYRVNQLNLPQQKYEARNPQTKKIEQVYRDEDQRKNVIQIDGCRYKQCTQDTVKELAFGISFLPNLQELSLRDNGITDQFLEAMEPIFQYKFLNKVDLAQNNIAKLGLQRISQAMQECWLDLQYLDISSNNYAPFGTQVSQFASTLREHPNLRSLHATLGGNPAAAVIRAICFNKKVEELSLTQSKLGEGALKLLEANLLNKRVPSTLRSLNFRNSILEPKCQMILAKIIKYNKTLNYLNLQRVGINDQMGVYIAKALRRNQSITEINLQSNLLFNNFCQEFGMTIAKNRSLTICNISKNLFNETGAKFIYKSLKLNPTGINNLGNWSQNHLIPVLLREKIINMLNKEEYILLAEEKLDNDIRPWNLTNLIQF